MNGPHQIEETHCMQCDREHNEAITVLQAHITRLYDAIKWALGYYNFRKRKAGEGAYWWRRELRSLSGFDETPAQSLAARDAAIWNEAADYLESECQDQNRGGCIKKLRLKAKEPS